MSDQEPPTSKAQQVLERRLGRMRRRHERQRLALHALQVAHDMLTSEIEQVEQELRQAA